MDEIAGLTQLHNYIDRFGAIGAQSTGSDVVDFAGALYNVKGSTRDPKLGRSWKQLLIREGVTGPNCYVTNPGAKGSHAEFSVGGHMTPDSQGAVETGATCYLMPLCSWHNSTSRDGVRFEHTKTKMLLLSGYMEGELAATFEVRRSTTDGFGVVYFSDGVWKSGSHANPALLPALMDEQGVEAFVVFEQVEGKHYVRDAHLPIP